MAKLKFQNLIFINPLFKKFLINILKDKNLNMKKKIELIEKEKTEEKELEKEFRKKVSNFTKLKDQKNKTFEEYKGFLLDTIKNLDSTERSIFLTILVKNDLSKVSWKTFNISKSTFYRKLKFIEKVLKWCLFG